MTQQMDTLHFAPETFECEVKELYTLDENTLGVVLDQTAFFPAGGGQSGDRGTLGDCYVENVETRDGTILHLVKNCEETVRKLAVGTHLTAKIDRNKRFSDMQQHSGEHILSGIVHRLFGYSNVGFHLSDREVTVDFDGVLTENDVCKVEGLVNEAIWDNREVRVFFPTDAEKERLSYRSKKQVDGPLRLVEIAGIDLCACCAPHVRHTGEIGALRVIKSEKNKGGTRLWILCGKRLMADTRQKLEQNRLISTMLSAKQNETAVFVQKLKDDHAALQYELVGVRRKLLGLQAAALPEKDVQVSFLDADADTLRYAAGLFAGRARSFAFVCGEGGNFVLQTQTNFDLQPVMQLLRTQCGARGGGRGSVMQGSVHADKETLQSLLESAGKTAK